MFLQSGFGLGDIVGGFTDLLSAAFADLVSFLLAFVNALYGALVYVYQVLVMVANFLYNALVNLVNHLRAVAAWIHERLLSKIIEWISTIKAKLHAIFDPIISVIRKIQALQRWYYQNVLKPFLDFIQRLRRVLLIFRLLHFKFATQLDAYLAQQEAKVARAFLATQVKLNQVINWLNLFVDPFGNIYSSVFLNAALTSINALWALLWGAQSRSLTGPELAGQAKDAAVGTRADTTSGVRLRASTGLTPDDTALQLEARQDFAALGYTA